MLRTLLCSICQLSFLSPWLSKDVSGVATCTFCKHYTPTKDTRYSMLQDVENRFMYSGYTSRREFYPLQIEYMNKWADTQKLPPATAMELSYEQQLLKVQDWTREYWH